MHVRSPVARACLTALAFGAGLFATRPAFACGAEHDIAPLGLVAVGGLVTATIYDVNKIASDERPSPFWAYSQALIATPVAFALGFEATDAAEVQALAVFLQGWSAALSGFGVGSLAVDRTRAGGVGSAIGLTAVSVEHATLMLLGHRPSDGGFVVQMLLAAPGVAAGVNWAADARSTADIAGGLTLAGVATISLLHGFASHVVTQSETSPKAAARRLPVVGLGCSEMRTCTFTVSKTW